MAPNVNTRTNFRPRPLDVQRKLTIVRNRSELDARDEGDGQGGDQATVLTGDDTRPAGKGAAHHPESGAPVQQSKNPDAEAQAAVAAATHADHGAAGKVVEIPVPAIRQVPTYEGDYKPTFRPPRTYLRRRGVGGFRSEIYINYDLDAQDVEWLDKFNAGQNRLAPDKMEAMMFRLEMLNKRMTEDALLMAGASLTERQSHQACAITSHLTDDIAIGALVEAMGLRPVVCRQVVKYWRQKRSKFGKPFIRELQAPTNPQDPNPMHCFRAREKAHRPQTRRRRENDVRSFEKLREMRDNMAQALAILEQVVKREHLKRELVRVDMGFKSYQMALSMHNRDQHAQIERNFQAQLGNRQREAFGEPDRASLVPPPPVPRNLVSRDAIRRVIAARVSREGALRSVAAAGPPPTEPDPTAAFLLEQLPEAHVEKALEGLPEGVPRRAVRARVGRGGRIVLDRCNPLRPDLPFESMGADGPMMMGLSAVNNGG
ncbi:unnamed protein product [Pedinophyceae sp. YPF-701]|nr:unnamed protein product [Pedinophyceae sp. YPF-701]